MYNWRLLLRISLCIICLGLFSQQASALTWTKLKSNKNSTLFLDKDSVALKNNLKKAWLKITYKTTQQNSIEPDKKYNLSKVLWYFNCAEQKSATSQVAQYLDSEMVYSAGIDVKKAEFIDPVPETDVDAAMRFVCAYDRSAEEAKAAALIAEKKAAKEAQKKAEEEARIAEQEAFKKAEEERIAQEKIEEAAFEKAAKEDEKGKKSKYKKSKKTKNKKDGEWSYEDDTGPEHWGKLKYKFVACRTGKNQSPIDIDKTVKAKLNKIRNIQKFPAKEISNTGHSIQVNFDFGNMLVLDDMPYQMKQVNFHSPSETTIKGESFPIEAQFLHADKHGNTTIVSVLFIEGKPNKALSKLWLQLPKMGKRPPKKLNTRVRAKDLMPTDRHYYRFNGSLTTPPCTEGVKWVVLKKPLSASTAQIEKLRKVMKHQNNRPVQPINGRVVLE